MDFNRSWIDLRLATQKQCRELHENRTSFVMLAGAVFALHQDTLRYLGVDLRKTEDVLIGAAMDKARPHLLGDFPERVELAMKAMNRINDLNLDLLQMQPPTEFNRQEYEIQCHLALLRSVAARIWLLTIFAKSQDDPSMKLGLTNIWLMFKDVEAQDLLDDAQMFTGTFFENVKSDRMNLSHWSP